MKKKKLNDPLYSCITDETIDSLLASCDPKELLSGGGLLNHLKHGCHSSRFGPDIYSSGDSFDGWHDHQPTADPTHPRSHVSPPGFKLAVLWKRHHPPISLRAVPGH